MRLGAIHPWIHKFFEGVFIFIFSLLLYEGIVGLGFRYASIIPDAALPAFRSLYREYSMPLIQFDPDCVEYDSKLTYKLIPGECRFKSHEFDTPVRINSAGFRDNEKDLIEPEIIIIGDSFAFGWGVLAEDGFAGVLQVLTNKTVLNTGVPSYGTVREYLSLRRVDMQSVKTVVLQYNQNDWQENKYYFNSKRQFRPMLKQRYLKVSDFSQIKRSYVFGNHLMNSFQLMISGSALEVVRPSSPAEQAAFLWQLAGDLLNDYPQVRLLITQIEPVDQEQSIVLKALHEIMKSSHVDASRLRLLDVSMILRSEKNFFRLDPHINAAGHRVVAQAMAKSLEW